MFFKIVILGRKVWGNKNGSSMASLQKHPFGTFLFKSVPSVIVFMIMSFYLSFNNSISRSVVLSMNMSFYLLIICSIYHLIMHTIYCYFWSIICLFHQSFVPSFCQSKEQYSIYHSFVRSIIRSIYHLFWHSFYLLYVCSLYHSIDLLFLFSVLSIVCSVYSSICLWNIHLFGLSVYH